MAFHRSIPGHAPTPLVEVPALADELGVGRVFVKEERERFGLPAFKVLGVSWAVARVVLAAAARAPGDLTDEQSTTPDAAPVTWDRVTAAARTIDLTLVTATDGNHGRALASIARRLGLDCRVFVPAVMAPGPAAAIADEDAVVVRHAGTYDEAVAAAAAEADGDPRTALVQDTAWPGYEQVPTWIVEGYSTLCAEVDDQLAEQLDTTGSVAHEVDLTVVPTGVGSLAQAVVTWNRSRPLPPGRPNDPGSGADTSGDHDAGTRPGRAVLAVEPDSAACVVASLGAGARVTVPTAATIMAGLNCGTPSSLAWPVLAQGLDGAVAVTDDQAVTAVADLTDVGIDAGPSGAAALAGARVALVGPRAAPRRDRLGVHPEAIVVLLSTEGHQGVAP